MFDMGHILTSLKLNGAYNIMNFDIPKLQKNILLVYYKFEQPCAMVPNHPYIHTDIEHIILSEQESFMIYLHCNI